MRFKQGVGLHYDRPPAIVIGACGHGLAVIHALAIEGVPVIVIESDRSIPGVCTNAAHIEFVPSMDGVSFIDELVALRRRISCPAKPVLFLANDRMVKLFGVNWECLDDLYFLSWSGCRESILRFVEKSSLENRCREVGLNYPDTQVIDTAACVDRVTDALGFPLILKPTRPLSSFKTVIPESREKIFETVEAYSSDLPFLAQRFIPGGDETIFFTALYLLDGQVLARFDGHKLRSRPLGHTTVAESLVDDEVFKKTIEFFNGLRLSGPVSLELKRDANGTLWVIEPTVGRTDFWVGLCIANGVNLPYVEYCQQIGADITVSEQLDRRVWFNEERDPFGFFWFVYKNQPGLKGRGTIFLYFNFHDTKPALLAIGRILSGLYRSARRRIFRLGTEKIESGIEPRLASNIDSMPSDLIGLFDVAERSSVYLGRDWFVNLSSSVFSAGSQARFYGFMKKGKAHGVLPIVRANAWFGSKIESLSNYYSPIYSPIFVPEVTADDVSAMIGAVLNDNRDCTTLRFAPMDPSSEEFDKLFQGIRASGWVPFRYFCFGNWTLKANTGWESYFGQLPGILRSTIRRSRSRLTRDGGCIEIVTNEGEVPRALQAYQEVYAHSGKCAEPFADFIPGLVELSARKGWLRMGITWLNSHPIAAEIWIVANGKADIYKLAYDERYKHYSPGTILSAALMQYVFQIDKVSEVDYLIGDDPYKKQWMSHRRERWGIVAYNPRTVSGLLGLVRELLGRGAKRILEKPGLRNGSSELGAEWNDYRLHPWAEMLSTDAADRRRRI